MVSLYFLLSSCSETQSPTHQAQVQAQEAPTPMAAAPAPAPPRDSDEDILLAALNAAGACLEDGGNTAAVLTHSMDNVAPLIEAQCAFYANQGTYEYWRATPSGLKPAARVGETAPLYVVGTPSFDTDTRSLKWLNKWRGAGDCGEWFHYVLEEEHFVLKTHRRRECSDEPLPDGFIIPDDFPLIASSETPPKSTENP